MARRINHAALRLYVLKADVDRLLPFINAANSADIRPGTTPLEPLTPDESRHTIGNVNVRAFIDWMADYSDRDEPLLKAALATINQRAPGMLMEPDDIDYTDNNASVSGGVVTSGKSEPARPHNPPAPEPSSIGSKQVVRRKDKRPVDAGETADDKENS